MPKHINKEHLNKDILGALAAGSARDTAVRFYGRNFNKNLNYISYFTLMSIGDTEPTIRVVFMNSKGRAIYSVELKRKDVLLSLQKPRVFENMAANNGASSIVICLSAPRGASTEEIYKEVRRIYSSFKRVNLYDFVLIDERRVSSLIRGAIPDKEDL